jgi:hypothetical protein
MLPGALVAMLMNFLSAAWLIPNEPAVNVTSSRQITIADFLIVFPPFAPVLDKASYL